jgi:hypothetical protein
VAGTNDYVSLESALQAFVGHILMEIGSLWGQPSGTIDGIEILGLRETFLGSIWQRIRSLFGSRRRRTCSQRVHQPPNH